MRGFKFFCLCLMVLAVAMGVHHLKNGPPKPPRPRRPVQIPTTPEPDPGQTGGTAEPLPPPSDPASSAPSMEDFQVTASDSTTAPGDGGEGGDSGDGSTTASASADMGGDAILLAWEKLPRDPFEYSPYLEQLALTEKPPPADPNASGPEDVVRKPTQALPAEYTASVEIEEGLVAVIGRDMVRVNDLYNGKKVTKIENNLVFLEDESALYIMPKTGVRLDVASDGTYSISDEFYKHRNLH